MRLALAAALCAFALAAPPALGQPLAGPDGTSLNKVLVIGTDGTRWDLLGEGDQGRRAPNLARAAPGRLRAPVAAPVRAATR